MVSAGKLLFKMQFSSRIEQDDGFGNTVSGWQEEFDASCGITYLKGSEAVMASRLEAKSPIIIAIRNSANARRITAEWRAKDVRTGVIYQIKEHPRPSEDRAMLEMLAMSGVAG